MRCPRCQQEYRQTTGLRVWSPDATRFHAPIPARVDTDVENEAGEVCQPPVVHLADLFTVYPRAKAVCVGRVRRIRNASQGREYAS